MYKIKQDEYGGEVIILIKDGKILSIPSDKANTDYQEYLEWTKASPMNVAEGNTPEEAD